MEVKNCKLTTCPALFQIPVFAANPCCCLTLGYLGATPRFCSGFMAAQLCFLPELESRPIALWKTRRLLEGVSSGRLWRPESGKADGQTRAEVRQTEGGGQMRNYSELELTGSGDRCLER